MLPPICFLSPNLFLTNSFVFSCVERADIIKVYDGTTSSDPAIKILCNEGSEKEILSTGSDLFVEFVSNSDWPGQGFKASYQFLPIEENLIGNYHTSYIMYKLWQRCGYGSSPPTSKLLRGNCKDLGKALNKDDSQKGK